MKEASVLLITLNKMSCSGVNGEDDDMPHTARRKKYTNDTSSYCTFGVLSLLWWFIVFIRTSIVFLTAKQPKDVPS